MIELALTIAIGVFIGLMLFYNPAELVSWVKIIVVLILWLAFIAFLLGIVGLIIYYIYGLKQHTIEFKWWHLLAILFIGILIEYISPEKNN